MSFSDFCDNSKKLNRIIMVSGGLIITGMLLCCPLFVTLTAIQSKLLSTGLNAWLPIFGFIVGWLFKAEKDKS